MSNNVNEEDVTVRFKMPAQRGSPDTSDPARFYMPAERRKYDPSVQDVQDEDRGGVVEAGAARFLTPARNPAQNTTSSNLIEKDITN